MASIRVEEVRIPRWVRDAVAQHDEVVVVNRNRPVCVIVHPDDRPRRTVPSRGRPLREALAVLTQSALPDPAFADDMEAVLDTIEPPEAIRRRMD